MAEPRTLRAVNQNINARTSLLSAYRTSPAAVRETLDDIPEEWLTWSPAPGINTPGFLLWHLLRDEDVIVQAQLAQRPQRWVAEGWVELAGTPADEQGTGFTQQAALGIALSHAQLRAYAEQVCARRRTSWRGLRPNDSPN